MPTKEEEIRACTLAGCHRVGLYEDLTDPNSDAFLDREARELVEASDDECPIGPPYNDVLMTFREFMRSCLEGKGYTRIKIFLQRLCSTKESSDGPSGESSGEPSGDPFTWRDFCRWHVPRIRK